MCGVDSVNSSSSAITSGLVDGAGERLGHPIKPSGRENCAGLTGRASGTVGDLEAIEQALERSRAHGDQIQYLQVERKGGDVQQMMS